MIWLKMKNTPPLLLLAKGEIKMICAELDLTYTKT